MSDEQNDRLLPHNIHAERAVLGAMLRSRIAIGDVVQGLRAQDFYAGANQTIFKAIVELWDGGKAVDLVTVADSLHQRKQIDDAGGYPYIAELWDAAPTAHGVDQHAAIVRRHAIHRGLLHTATEMMRRSVDGLMPESDALEAAEKDLYAIQSGTVSHVITLCQAMRLASDRMDERATRRGTVSGMATGWHDLDCLTAGLHKSELTVVAARPSAGKTAMAACLARHAALCEKVPTLFVSLEQTADELAQRIMCAEGGVDSNRLRQGLIRTDDVARLSAAMKVMNDAPLFIDDAHEQGMLHIASNARRLRMRHGIGLLIVDYLQLVEPENRKEVREQQVAAISRRLKRLARELQIPVVALAQLNREADKRSDGKPRLSDLRESGSIEADADVVILLHRPDLHRTKDSDLNQADTKGPVVPVVVMVEKQRNGPTGELVLWFRRDYMRLETTGPDPFEGT